MRRSLIFGGLAAAPSMVTAIGAGDADATFKAMTDAFMVRNGNNAYFKPSQADDTADNNWTGSLNIMVVQDAYERTGDPDLKVLINDLLVNWLGGNPPPWDWDGWNDDLGWFSMALIRGYQMTGNTEFLTQARYGFDYAFDRGWDTQYNGGGIWEENPEYCERYDPPKEPTKEALSNDSLGKVACMIYQSTHDIWYLDRCRQIYDWVILNLYQADSGRVNGGIHMDGRPNESPAVYNQGTFVDYANLLYEITGEHTYYETAKGALDYARRELTQNDIFTDTWWDRNTWADEVARGAGHMIRDHRLWDEYHSWMVQNGDSILANRNDRGLTWNGWDTPTPNNDTDRTNHYISAAAWIQYTPPTVPGPVGGIQIITNQETGLAIDSAGTVQDGATVIQWSENRAINQRWQLTQNRDGSWNMINISTWKSLDAGAGETAIQWQTTRNNNQRWKIEADGEWYKITNVDNGKVLDGAADGAEGAALRQAASNDQQSQRWRIS